MKIRVLVRKGRNRRVFVVQLLNIKDEWAQLREFGDFDETAVYLKNLKTPTIRSPMTTSSTPPGTEAATYDDSAMIAFLIGYLQHHEQVAGLPSARDVRGRTR